MRIAVSALGVFVTILLAAPVGPAAGQVLYSSPQRISRLSASGGSLSWAQQPAGKACFVVYRGRAAGATAPVRLTRCRYGTRRAFAWMRPWTRLAGSGVFWQEAGFGTTEIDEWIYSRFPGRPRSQTLYTTGCGGTGGRMLGPIAAGVMVFTVLTPTTDGGCDLVGGTGVIRRTVVAGGTVRRPLVPGAPPADLLTVAGRRLLEVPAAVTAMRGLQPTPTLQLRGLRSGRLRWSAALTAAPRAVAVSPSFAAALVPAAGGGVSIRAYAVGSGAPVRALTVRAGALPALAMVGPRVVYAYPRSLMVWNVRTNAVHRLALTPSVRNLSADGRLIVWNTAHTIRGVTLPPLG